MTPSHVTVAGKDYIVSGSFAAQPQPQPMLRAPYIEGDLKVGHSFDLEALGAHPETVIVSWPNGEQWTFDNMVVTGTRHDLARGIITVRWEET